jgi:DNA-binding beta-propeller fold protein YncE
MITALVFAALQQVPPPEPHRRVPDPGVVATAQQVTPAGVQSVFQGRVAGVRFGAGANELWVAVPGFAYRLDWRANRVLSLGAFDGTPGVHGLAVDRVTHRVLVSSVGRLPAAVATSRTPGAPVPVDARVTAQLAVYDGSRTGEEPLSPRAHSGPLGSYMAGGPAVALRPNASGHRIGVLPLPADDKVAVLDADSGELLHLVDAGVLPVAAVVSPDGSEAWFTNFGGPKPSSGERAALQCCDPMAEAVRVDSRGIAQAGTVSRLDPVAGTVTATVDVGRHPTGVAWDTARGRLYVADGNSDAVTVVDTRSARRVITNPIRPFNEREAGLAPTAVALSPDGLTLYVALGGANAVAVYDAAPREGDALLFRGAIPTAWYPSSLDVSPDGTTLAVGSLLGVGSGEGRTSGSPGKRGRYVHAVRGAVNVVPVPTDAELAAYSTSVAENNGVTIAGRGVAASRTPRPHVPARAVPERPGEPSLIEHVVFVIRENRTYDQVLGDMGRGAGDTSLVIYGRDVTPNTHALADRYVLLDHFFASGGNSADGHQWLTQANETDYPMWPLYQGRGYPYNGVDPLTYSQGGFLWEAAASRGRTVSVFGEYAEEPETNEASNRRRLLAEYLSRGDDPAYFRRLLAERYHTGSDIPSLDPILVREYPGWTMETPDVVQAQVVLDHVRAWEEAGAMPNLVMIILPSDHTSGTSPGWSTPRASVADNDLALGKVVEGLTHSSFWRSMAILVVEDDAQNGVDHIDGHRTVALAISPYARRGVVDSTFYAQPSMVKTIELMLGLPALSMFDLVATDMRSSFIGEGDQPDFEPYTALVPDQPLDEVNPSADELDGKAREAALASARMRLDVPDAAPSDLLNRILWHDVRGWETPFPGVRRSLFFPLSVDLADDEREEVEPGEPGEVREEVPYRW